MDEQMEETRQKPVVAYRNEVTGKIHLYPECPAYKKAAYRQEVKCSVPFRSDICGRCLNQALNEMLKP